MVIVFSIFATLFNYDNSFAISSNSTLTLSNNNTLLKLFEIEKGVKLAIKNIPIDVNYSIGHLKKASRLVDANLEKELQSLEPRIFNQIQNQISDLKIIVNTTTIPQLVKGAQISEGLSHIVDLVQLLQVDKIENETTMVETLPYFFSSLNKDILNSYNNSKIWLKNQTIIQTNNNTQDVNQSNTINSSDYAKTLEYQTAQDYSAGILDFIDNLNYLKPDAFTNYNITKLKNDYSLLNQLINNKSDINEIKNFSFQILN
ncbi:MAG: hypothetical protein AB7F53_02905 [Nitrososphaeraceae archaeon]